MQAGTVIDGMYVVEGVLGEGGMGVVVAAHHIATRQPLAIKFLKSVGNPTHTQRFLRELRSSSKLTSPHTARIFGYGTCADGRPYIAMELLEGPDLAAIIDDRPLAISLAATYIMQACAALAEAHAYGIVHRDIKPANLMLARTAFGPPIVKLVDFGCATPAKADAGDDQITALHSVVGSANYMSPEQIRSARDLDARSDIWSLGITLYELISGRLPFPGQTFAGVALAITGDDHVPLHEAPPAIRAIVDRCLAKERNDRYTSVGELAVALAPFALADQLPHAPAPRDSADSITVAVPPLIVRPRRRDYTKAWIAVAVAAIALLGFSVLALGGDDLDLPQTSHPPQPAAVAPKPIVTPI